MKVELISIYGKKEALLGLGLSYGMTSNLTLKEIEGDVYLQLCSIAKRLAPLGGSHTKFMESIVTYLDISAPRFWWSEFDTYRVGVTKQSESTMHTLNKEGYTLEFEYDIPGEVLNAVLSETDLVRKKALLPESFIQRRIVCTNLKTLNHIYNQRKDHKLPQWKEFCNLIQVINNVVFE